VCSTDITIPVPSLSEHVSEVVITRWLVAQGDSVDEGTPLVEVATDKVDTEIPSPHRGTILTMHAAEDDVVAPGAPLVTIGRAKPASPPDEPAASQPALSEFASSAAELPHQETVMPRRQLVQQHQPRQKLTPIPPDRPAPSNRFRGSVRRSPAACVNHSRTPRS
jgi:pyruvate/2-oxoglutarate dehydrogenase complex dihydrolipoamide acyltransferase (E2) component